MPDWLLGAPQVRSLQLCNNSSSSDGKGAVVLSKSDFISPWKHRVCLWGGGSGESTAGGRLSLGPGTAGLSLNSAGSQFPDQEHRGHYTHPV